MTTMAIVGNKGSGKTLLATAMAANDGRRILSNYVLRLPNYAPVEPEDLYGITEPTRLLSISYAVFCLKKKKKKKKKK